MDRDRLADWGCLLEGLVLLAFMIWGLVVYLRS